MKSISKFYKEISMLKSSLDKKSLWTYIKNIILKCPKILFEKSLGPADIMMKDSICEFNIFGEKLIISGEYFSGGREIYSEKVYFPEQDFRIKKGDIVLDLGANVGIFSLLACKIAKKVIAVEAQSEFIPIIKKNISRSNCPNNINIEFGIIGKDKGVFSDDTKLQSASHYKKNPPLLSMQNIISKNKLERIDFLKCDIEGSEFSLFDKKSDLSWLNKVKYISMEVHKNYGNPIKLCETLSENGFYVKLTNRNQKEVKNLNELYGFIYAKKREK